MVRDRGRETEGRERQRERERGERDVATLTNERGVDSPSHTLSQLEAYAARFKASAFRAPPPPPPHTHA